MRSDREKVPGGFSKADADKAETMEAALQPQSGMMSPMVAPGCQVYWPSPYEVCGAIKDKYNSLGGPNSFLLWPTSNELVNPDGFGRRNTFQNGPIYWSASSGAHPVVNHFFACWQRNGWEAGVLGYPTTDEIVNPDPVAPIGRRQVFQGGTIYWKLNEAYYVTGSIRDKWGQTGWEQGFLGYPMSDEIKLPDGQGRMNRFEHGVIYWAPWTGAHPVSGGILDRWAASGYERGSYGYPIADQTSAGGIEVRQNFEFAVLGWPTNPSAAIVDDGDINPTVDDGSPTSPADFAADANVGKDTSRAPELVGNVVKRSDPCVNQSCVDPEDPNLASSDPPTYALPSECFTIPNDGRLRGNRKQACSLSTFAMTVRRKDPVTQAVEVVGKLPFNLRTGVLTSHRSGKIIQEYRFEFGAPYQEIGVPKLNYQLSYEGSADQSRYSVSGFTSGSTVSPNTTMAITVTWNEQLLDDGAVDYRTTELRFDFSNIAPFIPSPYEYVTIDGDLRCDKTMKNRQGYVQGCVLPKFVPGLDYRGNSDGGRFPQAVGHIQSATGSGLPGASLSRPLHRESDVGARNNNRLTACPRTASISGPRQVSGRSCDEYPFASTKEGAASGGPGRTFNPNCHVPDLGTSTASTGYSVCMIDAGQNSLAGSYLGRFYGFGRVIGGDAFYVAATGGALPPPP
ncbi:hypothetical protein FOS14_11245 [Skermania sp. ID1734]|nr:hypothetical protein FOS14_11245 [Skermania sp. ID1734]